MYREVNKQMTDNQAVKDFPNSYIAMRRNDNRLAQEGLALYEGDNEEELFDMILKRLDKSRCIIIEGVNHRRSLGGLLKGG